MQKSAEIMRVMNNLVKLPEIAETMQSLSKEMVKAGVIEEMVDDVFDQEESDLDDEAEEEVDRVLAEITSDLFDKAGSVPVQQVRRRPVLREGGCLVDQGWSCFDADQRPVDCSPVCPRRWPRHRRRRSRQRPWRRRKTIRSLRPCRPDWTA